MFVLTCILCSTIEYHYINMVLYTLINIYIQTFTNIHLQTYFSATYRHEVSLQSDVVNLGCVGSKVLWEVNRQMPSLRKPGNPKTSEDIGCQQYLIKVLCIRVRFYIHSMASCTLDSSQADLFNQTPSLLLCEAFSHAEINPQNTTHTQVSTTVNSQVLEQQTE